MTVVRRNWATLALLASIAFAPFAPVSAQLTQEATVKSPPKGTSALNPQPEVPSKPGPGKSGSTPAADLKAAPAAGAGTKAPPKGTKALNPQPEVPSRPNEQKADKKVIPEKKEKADKSERENKAAPAKPKY